MLNLFGERKKKIGAALLLGMMGLLILLPFASTVVMAQEKAVVAEGGAEAEGEEKPAMGKDVFYKEVGEFGPISSPPAPKLEYPRDYGTYGNFQSRTIIWIANQQHLYFGSFVLAVPMFVWVMELIGMLNF